MKIHAIRILQLAPMEKVRAVTFCGFEGFKGRNTLTEYMTLERNPFTALEVKQTDKRVTCGVCRACS